MKKVYLFCDKYAKWIYLGLFILSIASLFIPVCILNHYSLGLITPHSIIKMYGYWLRSPKWTIALIIIGLISLVTMVILQFIKYRIHYIGLSNVFILVTILFYIIDRTMGNITSPAFIFPAIPHIAFYLYLLIFLFCLFMSVMQLVTKQPIRMTPKKEKQLTEPKPHKLTDKERIAELEKQVAELKDKTPD